MIRPITINLCGLVISRFASGSSRGFHSGNFIRGFLRESLSLPATREAAPKVLPHLISSHVTKQPRSLEQLATSSGLSVAEVRECVRELSRDDRAILRTLDESQQTWEISHDFLVPMLDAILARWTVSFARRVRPWLPWLAAAVLASLTVSGRSNRGDPKGELADIGWRISMEDGVLNLSESRPLIGRSFSALQRVKEPLAISFEGFYGNEINDPDLARLCKLKTLSSLTLDGGVADLSFLSSCKSLKSFDLGRGTGYPAAADLTGLSSLRDLKKLTSLTLQNTKMSDLTPLNDLKNLTALDLRGNTEISNLSPLKDLDQLYELYLNDDAKVTDLSPLRNLKSMEFLRLSLTNASDLSPLMDMTKLTSLDFSGTKVTDLSPLKAMTKLTSLRLSETPANDLSSLKNMTKLTSLEVSKTKVTDLSPLRNLKSLTTLYASNTQVTDLSPLKNMTSLTFLDLGNTSVADLSPLTHLVNLTVLNFCGSRVIDLSPLKDSKVLTIQSDGCSASR